MLCHAFPLNKLIWRLLVKHCWVSVVVTWQHKLHVMLTLSDFIFKPSSSTRRIGLVFWACCAKIDYIIIFLMKHCVSIYRLNLDLLKWFIDDNVAVIDSSNEHSRFVLVFFKSKLYMGKRKKILPKKWSKMQLHWACFDIITNTRRRISPPNS